MSCHGMEWNRMTMIHDPCANAKSIGYFSLETVYGKTSKVSKVGKVR